ncbi:MAG: dialkylresorcinol condensing enzyme DarA [Taibaiella sp.]|nr:dialkylresorcinol condensing enzyme DarA [Taibaiella sp.]
MKPRILVLYYTQTGQLRDILDNVISDIKDKAEIDFAAIEPVKAFPFPWTTYEFFDAMPEGVERIPLEIKPLPDAIMNAHYDLVLFGYQPWFLNPSQPINGFLLSKWASVLKGKPVVTVIGSRNMWLHAQEKVKEGIENAGGKLVGNIALVDNNTNLVSLLSFIRFAFKGQKEKSRFLPAAGVQDKDIKASKRFGPPIYEHLVNGTLDSLQDELLGIGSVALNPGLVLLEQRGIKNFRFWANYIRQKGGAGDPNRKGRVKQFQRLLLTAIFVLSPLSSLTAFIKLQLNKRTLLKDVAYFKNTAYEAGRI